MNQSKPLLRIHRILLAGAATIFVMAQMPSAFAQVPPGSDSVLVRADVAGAMVVESLDEEIYLGLLLPSQDLDVQADGSTPDYPVARFRVAGPLPLTWALTVAWAATLDGDDVDNAGETLAFSAPSGASLCYSADDASGDTCSNEANGVQVSDHEGEGWVFIGYRVIVPAEPVEGSYSNETAITLTAEAIVGG
jgi:hypothetical protein